MKEEGKEDYIIELRGGEEHPRDRYNDLGRTVKKKTRIAMSNSEIRIAREAKANPKGFFQLYKTKVRDKIGPLRSSESLLDTDKAMSEALSKYFLTVLTGERLDVIPQGEQVYRGDEVGKLTNISISREDVIRQIDRLKVTKAPGPDEIFPRVLKECKGEISGHLLKVLRKSPGTGVVPDSWRQANVISIHKKGDKSLMDNYRPITLTSVIGKRLESIIVDRIRDHLDRHNLINDSQHEFIKGKSCLTSLLSIYNRVYEAADNDESYDVV